MKKKTILVLQDQDISSGDLRILIESLGFGVILGEREAIALTMAQERQVDLVIVGSGGSEAPE